MSLADTREEFSSYNNNKIKITDESDALCNIRECKLVEIIVDKFMQQFDDIIHSLYEFTSQ